MAETGPLKRVTLHENWMAQADPPKEAKTVKKWMAGRYSARQINFQIKMG